MLQLMQFPISLSCYVGQKVSPLIQKVCVCEGNIKAGIWKQRKSSKRTREELSFFLPNHQLNKQVPHNQNNPFEQLKNGASDYYQLALFSNYNFSLVGTFQKCQLYFSWRFLVILVLLQLALFSNSSFTSVIAFQLFLSYFNWRFLVIVISLQLALFSNSIFTSVITFLINVT